MLRNDFEANQMDVFEFDNKNVGKLVKIRIGHDNSGMGPAWCALTQLFVSMGMCFIGPHGVF